LSIFIIIEILSM